MPPPYPITIHTPVARYNLFVLKVPLNANKSHQTSLPKNCRQILMRYLGGLRCVTGKCWLTWMVKNTKKCNPTLPYPITFLGILHVWTITQMPRGSCQLSLQRTGENHKDAPTSHTAWSEITQSHTACSNGYGTEPVSVEDVVVRCYTILSWMPETMTTLIAHWRDCTPTKHCATQC